jgi:hypothetical protein
MSLLVKLPSSNHSQNNSRPLQNGNDNSLFSGTNEPTQRPIGSGPSQQQSTQSTTPAPGTSASGLQSMNRTVGSRQLNDAEKYGLPGLLDAMRNENNENFNLAIGHDLTTLGLDLNSSE